MSADAAGHGELTPDLVFEILSNTRRRMVLYYLRENGGTASVKELATQIAALENEVDVDELKRQQRKRVYVSLYQTHIPKLEETGIIEYDDAQVMVRLTARAGEFDAYLTSEADADYPWQVHYFALAALGGSVFVLSFLGVPGLTVIPTVALGIALMTLFAVSAGVQYWTHRKQERRIPPELQASGD